MADNNLEQAFARAITIAQRDELTARLPYLDVTIASAGIAKPGPLREWLQQRVIGDITSYKQTRSLQPFLPRFVAPTGTFTIATEKTRGMPILLAPEDPASHTLITGATGSAKTSFAKHLVTNLRAADPSVRVSYVDPKPDWQASALRDERCIPITENTPLCIAATPSFLTPDYYEQLVAKTFADATFGAAHTTRLLTEASRQARATHAKGYSIKDLGDIIERPSLKSLSFTERDSRTGIVGRLDIMRATMPGTYHARPGASLTMEDLCVNPVHWPMPSRLSTYEFLIALWINVLIHYHRYHHLTGLKSLIVMDEGLQLWQGDARHHITGTPLLDEAVSKTRSLGIGLVITTTSTREVSQMIRANTNLQVIMRLVDGAEAEEARRTFRLTQEQATYLHDRLQRGECLVRLSHKYPEVLLATFPKIDEPTISHNDWNDAAEQRVQRLLSERTTSTAEPSTTTMPESPPASESNGALKPAQQAIMHCLAEQDMLLVSEIADVTNSHPVVIDRARKPLETVFGFIESGRVGTGQGRGRRGIANSLTTNGWKYLGKAPPHGMRGGSSFEHRYWAVTIARRLGGHLEVDINGKSCDVILRHDPARHDAFFQAITDVAHRLTETTNALQPGDLCAIEVECTPERTALTNAIKNAEIARIPLTILAIDGDLKSTVELLKRDLASELWPTILVVDVLWLVGYCRQHGAGGREGTA